MRFKRPITTLCRCILVLTAAAGLASCATQERKIAERCLAPGDSRVAGQFALRVKQRSQSSEIVVVGQWEGAQLWLRGFSTIGANVVVAHWNGDALAVESPTLYRGPDLEPVLWGLLVYQLRDELASCWSSADGQVQIVDDDTLQLRTKARPVFVSAGPGEFTLPVQDISVQVRGLE